MFYIGNKKLLLILAFKILYICKLFYLQKKSPELSEILEGSTVKSHFSKDLSNHQIKLHYFGVVHIDLMKFH